MATINGSATDDTLIGAANDADLFIFGRPSRSANDTVTGGAGLTPDTLRLTTSGDITAQLLAHKSGFGPITLSATGNSVTLDQVFLTADGQTYGNDTGNMLTITSTASQVVTYRAVGGGDTVQGGLRG